MNHDQLDAKLRKLTDRDLHYQAHPSAHSATYDSLKRVDHEGQKVYVFADMIGEKDNITISKHTRFAEVPLHIHTFIELSFVYSGQCTQIINGKKVTLKSGQICIVDTGIPHAILSTSEEDVIINILIRKRYFSSSFLSKLANNGILSHFLANAISDRKNHNRYIIFHSENNTNIPILMRQLLCEFYDPSLGSSEMMDSYMLLIFYELLRVFQYDTNRPRTLTQNKVTIIEILKYIENHYMDCTLTSTAEHFNFNANYLSTLIKKTTGQTFKDLVQSEKFNYCAFLLANTNRPIYDIASSTGHSNLSFFYKKFQDHFGITPQQYREQHAARIME
ncbi:AraC-like DNA-binding protein/mannose-6-phosphate isomerase-like protein (cupin superfamily) [Paenibacillus sp. DS2363]|uniref:helix-turn-helix domain-containing protein n=1 Tax=Paenibacillus TaxID=44249 RepID=UPI00209FF638|nr:helix-turn-helix domain-containing protein [Paenibacillus xylanexedens]MCP1427215.1 AraC-like DNA-binding protein/mannose-6-phosphate isomerase-like protein (cupin superfamily) [Paenibacillus xylanexedens]